MNSKECFDCYLYTGFVHKYPSSMTHTHDIKTGKLVFKYSSDERAKMEFEEMLEHSRHTYYGVTPFHAEGTTLSKIIERHLL